MCKGIAKISSRTDIIYIECFTFIIKSFLGSSGLKKRFKLITTQIIFLQFSQTIEDISKEKTRKTRPNVYKSALWNYVR